MVAVKSPFLYNTKNMLNYVYFATFLKWDERISAEACHSEDSGE